jgi:Ni/Fe-hydrogenase subunit HybB-like protein
MSADLNMESTSRGTAAAYADRPVTKAPNWHGLVALDVLFNNLSTGLFLAAALGELAAPAHFEALAGVAYPIALLFLIADLVCLVLDLGDPLRFHHMLRVWKPSSPMSLGTWCLTAYALPLTALAAMSLLPGGDAVPDAIRRLTLVAGMVPAIGAAVYKGVLFSTSAQPGWCDARWLGGYLSNSALMLGAATLLVLADVMGQSTAIAVLRLALMLMLVLNLGMLGLLLAGLRAPLARAHGPRALAVLAALVIAAGSLLPLLLLALRPTGHVAGTALFMLLGAAVARAEIVRLPHRLADAGRSR